MLLRLLLGLQSEAGCEIENYAGKSAGPNFMALLTVSKESVLTEAGNFALTQERISGVSKKFLF